MEFVNKFSKKLNKVIEDVAALAEVLKSSIGDLEEEVGLLKQAVGNTLRSKDGHLKAKVLKPKVYSRTRNATELENFLWDMEQYFRPARVLKAKCTTITSIYLDGDAKLWQQSRL